MVLPSSGSPCSSARRCVSSWGASVKNRWGSWLGKSAFCRSAFSSPAANFAVPERKKKASILGRCLSQDATWLAKSYSRPQLAFLPSFFYSPFSLSLVFTPSFGRSCSISCSLPPAFSNLLLSFTCVVSLRPTPPFCPYLLLSSLFLEMCVFGCHPCESGSVLLSSQCGSGTNSWLGNTLRDVSKEKITKFSTLPSFYDE